MMDLEDSNWEMQIWKAQPRRVFVRREVHSNVRAKMNLHSPHPNHSIDTRPILDPCQPDRHSILTATIAAYGHLLRDATMGRRLGHLERDPLQARQDIAAKKQQWRQFSSAVKNKNTECFCSWVRVPEARNWKAPKFWDELQYCEKHGKMGVRLGILHRWHRNRPKPTIIIDHGDTSYEELFGAGGQILAPRTHGPAEDERKRDSIAFRRVHYDSETYILRPKYTAHTIASDILQAAGIHPTQPPLNWNRDHRLLDI